MTRAIQTFDPATADPRAFRNALGQFGTGVTVVTTMTTTGPIGITANSFSSLSLDPPLVLWAPAKNSSRYPFFAAADHFAIHVLASDQRSVCEGFARDGDFFDTIDWTASPQNVPLLDGCLAVFECANEAVYDGGDHSISVGRVLRVTTNDGDPLLFQSGRYGSFLHTV